jgi:uncharacterized membrane protein YgdD (TMEM256/DUF423 family)
MVKLWSVLGALNALMSVATGAFGAHGLRARLTERMLQNWETAARYQMYHALGLLGVAWLASQKGASADASGWALVAGIALFSGSLYVMALTGVTKLGAVTPLGGLCFLVGWALFARVAAQ